MSDQNQYVRPAEAGTGCGDEFGGWELEATARKITLVCPDVLPELLLTREFLRSGSREPAEVAGVLARQRAVLRWGGPRVEVFLDVQALVLTSEDAAEAVLGRLYQHLFGLARYGGVTVRYVDYARHPDFRRGEPLTVVELATGELVVPLDLGAAMPCLDADRRHLDELDAIASTAHSGLTLLAEYTIGGYDDPDSNLGTQADAVALHRALGLTED